MKQAILGIVAATTLITPVFAHGQGPGQGQAPTAPTAPNPNTTPQGGAPGTNPANPAQSPAPNPNAQALPGANGNGANLSPDFDITRTITASLQSSTAIENARRALRSDIAREGIARAEGRPNISASGSATRYDAATLIRTTPDAPPFVALQDHSEQLTIGVSQRIDLTGQIRAASSQARLQTLADQFTVDRFAQDRVLLARTTYYNHLRAVHQVQVNESALRAAQSQREIARKLYEGGIGQKIDFLRAETNVASAEQDLTRAQNNADISRATFNDLVGRPLTAPVNAQDVDGVSFGETAAPAGGNNPVASTVGSNLPTPYTVPAAELDINPDTAIETAQSRRPDVLQNAVLVRVAETGVKLARAGQEPGFSLSAAGNYFPTTSFQTPRERTAGITASLVIPLYDGGATRARISEARTQVETAQANLGSSKSDAALSVRQAYLNLQTAARQINAANATLTQAFAARQLAQVRYEGQVGLFLEVTDAQAALVRAQNAQVDAVYDYLIARARFTNATGEPVQL